ncbi:hypothetical protein L596_001051 [Steinernema carpocapsae]|uniref:Uncharacterized protein n=1 Tax=Steinernema carpocapsae TaxID=34508 RepID=A0A4U8UKA4_STECR|nr:hypothetical protein L596_001051 [Steinernema carpocapsae]
MNQRPLTYLDSEDDGFSAIRPCDFYHKGRNLTCALKVGLPRTTMDEWMTPQELQAIRTRQEALEALDLGAKVREHIWKQFSLQYIAALREHGTPPCAPRSRKDAKQGGEGWHGRYPRRSTTATVQLEVSPHHPYHPEQEGPNRRS